MANFIFNPIKVAMANGTGDFNWLADDIVGVLYDNRLTVTPDMLWGDITSFVVAESSPMTGRVISSDGQLRGSTLEFLGVTTQPGLRIAGMLLQFSSANILICNFTEGLDGFSGNNDLSIEATNLDIFARTSAANQGAWIIL